MGPLPQEAVEGAGEMVLQAPAGDYLSSQFQGAGQESTIFPADEGLRVDSGSDNEGGVPVAAEDATAPALAAATSAVARGS